MLGEALTGSSKHSIRATNCIALERVSYHLSQHGDAPGHLGHVLHLDEVVQVEEVLFRDSESFQILQQDLDALLSVGAFQDLEPVTVNALTVAGVAALLAVGVAVAAGGVAVVVLSVGEAELRLQLGWFVSC